MTATAASPLPSRRLRADERRRSILAAARQAFGDTGDRNGTTVRRIAEVAGISEAIIYRHFESKDQLFYEAVVEPLHEAVDAIVAGAEEVGQEGPMSTARQAEVIHGLYRQLTNTFDEILPLLGLVLFGDPDLSRRFFRDHWLVAVERLSDLWADFQRRYGADAALAPISVRAVMGSALMLAVEESYTKGGIDRTQRFDEMAQGMMHGFFPRFDA